jgi:hypothetical protein
MAECRSESKTGSCMRMVPCLSSCYVISHSVTRLHSAPSFGFYNVVELGEWMATRKAMKWRAILGLLLLPRWGREPFSPLAHLTACVAPILVEKHHSPPTCHARSYMQAGSWEDAELGRAPACPPGSLTSRQPATLSWKGLTVTVKNKKGDQKRILKEVDGFVEPT